MMDNHKYSTSHTSLAAYLISEGFALESIEYKEDRAFFIFPDDESLQKSVTDYRTLRAIGNITLYEDIRRKLIAKIKYQEQWL